MLESRVVGGGQSGRDTGEISTWNNHTYKKLESLYGAEKTKQIAESQKAALQFVEQTVKQKKINCGFQRQDAFVFFEDPSVGPEFKAVLNAGLHDTKEVIFFTDETVCTVCKDIQRPLAMIAEVDAASTLTRLASCKLIPDSSEALFS